jgi:hypothetical protein
MHRFFSLFALTFLVACRAEPPDGEHGARTAPMQQPSFWGPLWCPNPVGQAIEFAAAMGQRIGPPCGPLSTVADYERRPPRYVMANGLYWNILPSSDTRNPRGIVDANGDLWEYHEGLEDRTSLPSAFGAPRGRNRSGFSYEYRDRRLVFIREHGEADRAWTFQYSDDSRYPSRLVGPTGEVWQFHGSLSDTSGYELREVTGPNEERWTFQYEPADNTRRLSSIIDPSGVTLAVQYSAIGRMQGISGPNQTCRFGDI